MYLYDQGYGKRSVTIAKMMYLYLQVK